MCPDKKNIFHLPLAIAVLLTLMTASLIFARYAFGAVHLVDGAPVESLETSPTADPIETRF